MEKPDFIQAHFIQKVGYVIVDSEEYDQFYSDAAIFGDSFEDGGSFHIVKSEVENMLKAPDEDTEESSFGIARYIMELYGPNDEINEIMILSDEK